MAPECDDDGEVVAFGERPQVGPPGIRPSATADQQHRSLGACEDTAHRGNVAIRRWPPVDLHAWPGNSGRQFPQHVFRERHHHWTRPVRARHDHGPFDDRRDVVGRLDLDDPLGEVVEERAVLDLLEGLEAPVLEFDLADEEQHRRRVLTCGVDADRGVGGARATGHEADAGSARELAVGLGHVGRAALLSTADEAQAIGRVVQGVEHGEVALAGDPEGGVDPLGEQAVDEQLPAGPLHGCSHAAHPRTVLCRRGISER